MALVHAPRGRRHDSRKRGREEAPVEAAWERKKGGDSGSSIFFKKSEDEIWLLTIYAKSEKDDMPAPILKRIREEIEND